MKKTSAIERFLERALFASRWVMAPFYAGLVIALLVLLVVFVHDIVVEFPALLSLDESDVILWVLTLIDLSLAANLLLMVIFAGYENFVSKMDVDGHPDRPSWMGTIDFSAMKLKLVASIVAISAIHLLKAFMSIDDYSREHILLLVAIHLTFALQGLFAFVSVQLIARIADALDTSSADSGIMRPPVLAAAFWAIAISIFLFTTNGLETGLAAMLLNMVMLRWLKLSAQTTPPALKEQLSMGALLGLLVLARIDSALLVTVLALFMTVRSLRSGMGWVRALVAPSVIAATETAPPSTRLRDFLPIDNIFNLPFRSLIVCRWQAAETAPPCTDFTIARP